MHFIFFRHYFNISLLGDKIREYLHIATKVWVFKISFRMLIEPAICLIID